MAPPRTTAAERRRAARERARSEARRSLRVGVLGIAILFLSGIGVLLLPGEVFVFIAGMVVGIVLILVAFLMVRGSVLSLKDEDQTKIY